MKKIMVILAILMIPLVISKNIDEETIIIPKDSIRIRVVANSNSINDQYEKLMVTENIQKYLEDLLKNSNSKTETATILKNNLSNIEKVVNDTLISNNSNIKYNVNYGNNYFPKKEYKGVSYESGFYESLVITLGKGKGNNWWCVLFPPLCLIETNEDISDMEYKLYISEIIEKNQ